MTIAIELGPEMEEALRGRAEAKGMPLEEYLPLLVARAVQQEAWEEMAPEESLGRLTMLAAQPFLSRIWGTPEEDAAWKYLEDEKGLEDEEDDASEATIAGSASAMRRLWDTPEEDEAWKHL